MGVLRAGKRGVVDCIALYLSEGKRSNRRTKPIEGAFTLGAPGCGVGAPGEKHRHRT